MPPNQDNQFSTNQPTRLRGYLWLLVLTCVVGFMLVFSVHYQLTAPKVFTPAVSFEVTPGMNVLDIATAAKQAGVVRSRMLLYATIVYRHDPTTIFAGRYVFSEPSSLLEVAAKLAAGEIDHDMVTLTIPEGVRATTIAEIARRSLTDFDTAEFIALAEPKEGFLFPETYFVPEDFTAEQLFTLLTDTYTAKTEPLAERFTSSNLTEYEVITLASILEREANDPVSMRIVSGILQNRLRIGMALQADASIEYVLDKELGDLVPDDLELDSPYNTYKYRGLVPTPIGNPGLVAIEAVLNPTPSSYLYYITGNDGVFYYAEDFDVHRDNIARYLR
jgi:UPF0755 protein